MLDMDMKMDTTGVMFAVFIATCILFVLKKLFERKNISGAVERFVLITGCDTGFGHSSAIHLSREKMFVFAGCLKNEGVERLTSDPSFHGQAFLMDVTKAEDISNTKHMVEAHTGGKGLWALINNAGILQIGPIEWQSVETMQNTMSVNLWGAVNVTKALLPLVKKAQGRIVNITSMAGRVLLLNGTSYSMSKFALEAFSDGLRYELKPWAVSVHVIEPGMFKTNILGKEKLQNDWKTIWDNQSEQTRRDFGEKYYSKAVAVTESLVSILGSSDISLVVGAISDAVLSKRPRLRYKVGVDANTLWMTIATMPTWVGDFITGLLANPETPAQMST